MKQKLLNREVFHGQTWNYRKSGEPFLMNWYCYAIYGERSKPIYYVAEQEDVTELETLRMKQRLLVNPQDDGSRWLSSPCWRVEAGRKSALNRFIEPLLADHGTPCLRN